MKVLIHLFDSNNIKILVSNIYKTYMKKKKLSTLIRL